MMDEKLAQYSGLLDPATMGEMDGPATLADRLPEPERKLMFAVLVDAITNKDGWWVAGIGGQGPFTFENVCETLGFDRKHLGMRLLAAFAADAALRRPRRAVSVGMSAQGREGHRKRARAKAGA